MISYAMPDFRIASYLSRDKICLPYPGIKVLILKRNHFCHPYAYCLPVCRSLFKFNVMKYNVVISILIFCSLSSCRKFVDPGSPTTQLGSKVIFNNEATATGAQLAIYAGMESGGFVYNVIRQSGLSADEFINYSSASEDINFALNNLTPDNYAVSVSWTNLYSFIYQANAVLEGLEGASNISSLASQQLKGEAKFVRAFMSLLSYGNIW